MTLREQLRVTSPLSLLACVRDRLRDYAMLLDAVAGDRPLMPGMSALAASLRREADVIQTKLDMEAERR